MRGARGYVRLCAVACLSLSLVASPGAFAGARAPTWTDFSCEARERDCWTQVMDARRERDAAEEENAVLRRKAVAWERHWADEHDEGRLSEAVGLVVAFVAVALVAFFSGVAVAEVER